jgi:hypothetical protein
MKIQLATMIVLTALSSAPAFAYDPIPGSLTYNGQPRTHLEKAPVGSTFTHQFSSDDGNTYEESYVIQPDHSVKLIGRILKSGGNR